MHLEEIRKTYPKSIPISWLLRESNKKSWFRIHSLPESKRYPETSEEYKILLKRHNELASDVLGEEQRVFLFWYGDKVSGAFLGEYVISYNSDDVETDIYSTEIKWKSQRYDSYIKCVAIEKCSSSIFYSQSSGDIYAPYDGGADVFIQSPTKRKFLKRKYKKWFSFHSSGM